jgi:hypothetical protein
MKPKKQRGKNPKHQNPNLEDETPKVLWAPRWLVDTSTSQGHKFCIRSPFGVHDSSLERTIQGLQLLVGARDAMETPGPPNVQKTPFRASK